MGAGLFLAKLATCRQPVASPGHANRGCQSLGKESLLKLEDIVMRRRFEAASFESVEANEVDF